jgi:uncharacterized protein
LAVSFEWDSRKEAANRRKHGASFTEAGTVFADGLAKIFDDRDHSEHEKRELMIGHSSTGRLLVVSFTERKPDEVRIISAREATRAETRDYEEAS